MSKDIHWADHSAGRVIEQFPDENIYTVASGITPSGYIHIGNFREVITSEFVRKALENKGKKTKFIYSWDSYDSFRKVPKDVPNQWEQYLRMPDAEVPNPFGDGNYAQEFMKTFEQEVSIFNFPIEFQNQYELQRSGIYADEIKTILQNKDTIKDILNKYRKEPLSDEWMPIDVYDDQTKKDSNTILSYDGEYTLTYENEQGVKKSVHFKNDPRVKLRWKADWPMRWNHFKVTFEPGGKDHSTPGSSYTVGSEIIQKIFNREPPVYTAYNWVLKKGEGGKISSSKGGAMRVKDVLEIYTPEMVLFLFAGTRPNAEINISFDMDVIKLYEDFDYVERLYFGLEEEKNEKKQENLKRVYELSHPNTVEIPKNCPYQPSIRHLTTLMQAQNFNFDTVKTLFSKHLQTQFDEIRFKQRYECAKNWLEKYAPEDMKFSLVEKLEPQNDKEKELLQAVKTALEKEENPKELFNQFKTIAQKHELSIQEFFEKMYLLFMNKTKGPKLGGFMIENKNKILELLKEY